MNNQQILSAVRRIGWIESGSFLLLIAIAMPLKYLFQEPILVKIVGSAHGGLWLLYIAVVLIAGYTHKWSLKLIGLGLLASLIPFGPLFFDRRIRQTNNQTESLETVPNSNEPGLAISQSKRV